MLQFKPHFENFIQNICIYQKRAVHLQSRSGNTPTAEFIDKTDTQNKQTDNII